MHNDYGTFYGRYIEKMIFMKPILIAAVLFITVNILPAKSANAQDTSQNQQLNQQHTYPVYNNNSNNYKTASKPHIYRDTRLGSSSPLYNTYQKNDYGAGAITNDPNKANGISQYRQNIFDTSKSSTNIYRDTRLGGSSSLYNSYRKNDYGAGAITTNPNKDAGSAPPQIYTEPDTTKK